MTNENANQDVPSFRTHSRLLGLLRDLSVIAICAAIVASFLLHVWRAPKAPPPEDLSAASAVVAPAAEG